MTTINTMALSDQQIDAYDEKGYLIIRNVLSPDEAVGLRRIVQQQVQYNSYPPSLKYPKPGKYTISGDGGPGPHCDYKRWRPVGSSMNWMFSIIPLTDFDLECGPFLVAPRSHKLTQVINKRARIWDITRPDIAQLSPFVDLELKAGDLPLVNQHTWHKAPAGISTQDRCGIFNKYCAVNSPPAAGYYPYNNAALSALSDAGKRLIPICFDQSIITTRLLIDCPSSRESKFLLLYDDESDWWGRMGRRKSNWLGHWGEDRFSASAH